MSGRLKLSARYIVHDASSLLIDIGYFLHRNMSLLNGDVINRLFILRNVCFYRTMAFLGSSTLQKQATIETNLLRHFCQSVKKLAII